MRKVGKRKRIKCGKKEKRESLKRGNSDERGAERIVEKNGKKERK